MVHRSGICCGTAAILLCSRFTTAFVPLRPPMGQNSVQTSIVTSSARENARRPRQSDVVNMSVEGGRPRRLESAEATIAQPTLEADSGDNIILPDIEVPEVHMTPTQRVMLWLEIRQAEPLLQAALEAQDFSTAAELRERLTTLKAKDPYFSLREKLDNAIAREEYFSAAKLKQQLDKLGAPVGFPAPLGREAKREEKELLEQKKEAQKEAESHTYSSYSDTTTAGVRIEVRSQYYPEQSNPSKDQYIFIYKVKITNNCPTTIQLVSRRWEIRTADAVNDKDKAKIGKKKGKDGNTQEVRGPGVVGQQPVLEPGQSFEYSSACPIFTGPLEDFRVLGRMKGGFLMVCGSRGEKSFEAKINPFYLLLPPEVLQQRTGKRS